MKRFVEGVDRNQATLFPDRLEDWVGEDNAVRVVDVYVDGLDLGSLGFGGVEPQATGRPAYHPSILLKLYIYGYLNRVPSSRRLEREAERNVEVMWLCGRLVPDHKTIADFRKDNGPALRKVCSQFVALCRQLDLLADASVAIDGSKFKAVNSANRAKGQFVKGDFVYVPKDDVYICPAGERLIYRFTSEEKGLNQRRYWTSACQSCAGERLIYRFTSEEKGLNQRRYWTSACQSCAIKDRCTTGKERRITRWEHEHVLEAVEQRLDENPDAMRVRRQTVEHPFGTIKSWMGATHFQTKTLKRVATEMALHVLAYNLKRVMNIIGIGALIAALQAA